MAERFAFESEELSIAFHSMAGLGDAVIARKILEAIIERAPNCVVDIYCQDAAHEIYAKAFYGDVKNLNRLLNANEYVENVGKYDLALYSGGCHVLLFESANFERLYAMAPELSACMAGIESFNKRNVYPFGDFRLGVAFRHMISAEVLHKNFFYFISGGGALPIRDDELHIPLDTEFKPQFDALNLDKYITIYTDIDESEVQRPKVKTWPIHCLHEYVARMKKRLPHVEIVQLGGGGILKSQMPTATSSAVTWS